MKRTKHSLSFYKLLTCNMSGLIPIGLVEVLPGDTFQHSTSALIRLAPLLAPVMHPLHVRIHHWFVPHRLTWTNWEKFITGGPDGMDASAFPTITLTNPAEGDIADYLGIPPGTYSPVVSALPFRAYNLIANNWYLDQDLMTPLAVSLADGADSTTAITGTSVCYEKDYFTTARPWTQKGPAVTIPLGTSAPVLGGTGAQFTWKGLKSADGTAGDAGDIKIAGGAGAIQDANSNPLALSPGGVGNLYADLTDATAADVNDVRFAFAMMRYEEARARYGSRYTEYLAYLGIKSSDARLQLPEYLGGGKQTIQFSEVLQTSPNEEADPAVGVGNMRGHGIGAMRSNRYRRFFEEHGYVISLMSIVPKTIYADGIDRTWNRRTKEDFFQKELQHIGQQGIKNKEIYAQHASPDGIFGYQNQYDDYRRMESKISGAFHTSLDYWHMARKFGSAPSLNDEFVMAGVFDRIFAEQPPNDPDYQFYVMARHQLHARRLVNKTGSSHIY